jgi:hypothetical protein
MVSLATCSRPTDIVLVGPSSSILSSASSVCPNLGVPPNVRSSLRNQRFEVVRASTPLLGHLKRHVAVAPHLVVFGRIPIPCHVLESVVGGTCLVPPVGPAENRLVGHRNRVEVIPKRQVGHGGRWQNSSSVVTITIREVVL